MADSLRTISQWRQAQIEATFEDGLRRLLDVESKLFPRVGGDAGFLRLESVSDQWSRVKGSSHQKLSLYGVPCCLCGKDEKDISEIADLQQYLQDNGAIVLKKILKTETSKWEEVILDPLCPVWVDVNGDTILKTLKAKIGLKVTRNIQIKYSKDNSKSLVIYAGNIIDIQALYRILVNDARTKSFDPNPKFAIPENANIFEYEIIEQFKPILNTLRELGLVITHRNFNDFRQLIEYLYCPANAKKADKYHEVKELIKRRSEFLEPSILEMLARIENGSNSYRAMTDFLRKDVVQSFESNLSGFILPNLYNFDYADLPAIAFPTSKSSDFFITVISSKYFEDGLIDLVQRFLSIQGEYISEINNYKVNSNATFDSFINSESFAIVMNSTNANLKLKNEIKKIGGFLRNSSKLPSQYNAVESFGIVAVNYLNGSVNRKEFDLEIWNIPKDKFNLLTSLANLSENLIVGEIELTTGEKVKSFLINEIRPKIQEKKPFESVLIANRGEIAVRIIRTLKRMNIKSIAIYTKPDQYSPHVEMADEAICLHGTNITETYLNIEQIIDVAKKSKAEAIIPGYGFLSENASFARACTNAGIVFVGPSAETIELLGLKHSARQIAKSANVPLVPGSDLIQTLDEAIAIAGKIQYPIMMKSTAGGGGIGLQKCDNKNELIQHYESVKHLAEQFFNNAGIFVERFVSNSRHVEVQIFGDGRGNAVHLGERDCSLQRRNQKVIEETPAPNIPEDIRQKIRESAVSLAKVMKYKNAGTVEFMYDPQNKEFYFLEVNTRLQVEHPITEEVTGLDLVEWMLLIAADMPPTAFFNPISIQGAAMEVRLYAENPVKCFLPSPGQLIEVNFPDDIRVDTWISKGTVVSSNFDPLLAKIIVYGKDRNDALLKMQKSLENTAVYGIVTNIDYLKSIINSEMFASVSITTKSLDTYNYIPKAIEIQDPGSYTSVQDYPGRVNYWHIGVPPSGPMDDYSFQLANKIVGNSSNAPAIEITLFGPTIIFHFPTVIALTGGTSDATLDGKPIRLWTPINVKAGQKLSVGKLASGCRSYLAIRGGLDVPEFLESRSTFALGNMGGFNGRTLKFGDVIFIGNFIEGNPLEVQSDMIPNFTNKWEVGVLYGPHGSPDFFTEESIENFLTSEWKVHYNSNRFGVRLIGPKPEWARKDGGEAGLHPSNAHDYVYPLGGINFTGDEPVILTCDGPSLGGFVCPFTVVESEMWKIGQVKPGDMIQFKMISWQQAVALKTKQNENIKSMSGKIMEPITPIENDNPVLCIFEDSQSSPQIVYRQAGDRYILIEYGDSSFNIQFTYRIYKLKQLITEQNIPGVVEVCPGVRSATIQYDNQVLTQSKLIDQLLVIESQIETTNNWTVPSRILYLPLAFEDDETLAAVKRYQETIRSDAPWLPNNVDFLQKINGLKSRDDIKFILYEGTFLVLGLGDVFLGAPCAIPLDPRHRLLGSKYNPSRTYTPNGTVGIGGMYFCIYTMESPGGYQLVGRTVPIWDKLTLGQERPWLLSIFDQIKFYPVTQERLAEYTELAQHGKYDFQIVETVFEFSKYNKWLQKNAKDIFEHNKKLQQGNAEMADLIKAVNTWTGQKEKSVEDDQDFGENVTRVYCNFVGRFWKKLVYVGDFVEKDQPLIVIEAMKTEMIVTAPKSGKVLKICGDCGDFIESGDIIAILE